MSGTAVATPSTLPPPDTTPQDAIASMTKAFDLAIKTNAEITVLKTEKGATETAAQQRPNIG